MADVDGDDISSGVWPAKAECGICVLCSSTKNFGDRSRTRGEVVETTCHGGDTVPSVVSAGFEIHVCAKGLRTQLGRIRGQIARAWQPFPSSMSTRTRERISATTFWTGRDDRLAKDRG